MKEGKIIDNFLALTLTIANKIKTHGEIISPTIINEKKLGSLLQILNKWFTLLKNPMI